MERRVITAHRATCAEPLSFRRGDALSTGQRDEEHPGWIRVTTGDGEAGWAHESLLAPGEPGGAVAREDYTARELDTVEGERVRSLRELDGWTWVENERGESGWVPLRTLGEPDA